MLQQLVHQSEFRVRFNEADPLGIVWHGNYLKYFEDGREHFGEKYDLKYLDIFSEGYVVPVVSMHCEWKRALKYGDAAIIETTYTDTPAAKLLFSYRILIKKTGEVAAVADSVQVFLEKETNALQWLIPAFFERWKEKWLRKAV